MSAKHTVWSYTLRDNRDRRFDFVMIGPPTDVGAARKALDMHFEPEQIISIFPKNSPTRLTNGAD